MNQKDNAKSNTTTASTDEQAQKNPSLTQKSVDTQSNSSKANSSKAKDTTSDVNSNGIDESEKNRPEAHAASPSIFDKSFEANNKDTHSKDK